MVNKMTTILALVEPTVQGIRVRTKNYDKKLYWGREGTMEAYGRDTCPSLGRVEDMSCIHIYLKGK